MSPFGPYQARAARGRERARRILVYRGAPQPPQFICNPPTYDELLHAAGNAEERGDDGAARRFILQALKLRESA